MSLDEAVGRYVAAPLRAHIDHPAFDNSAMDGYAVRIADVQANDFLLPVVGTSSAGEAQKSLAPGTAMRIYTGAALPLGADAVVIQEDVQLSGDRIRLPAAVRAGANVRRRGEDYRAGDVLYKQGRRIRAIDIALLAAAGTERVSVARRAHVLVVSTGNELVPVGRALGPGEIYESNGRVLRALLRSFGVDVTDAGIVRDDAEALHAVFATADRYDFVITSGGASVGAPDVVKSVYEKLGTIDLWKVRVKPGKPIAFGHLGARTHFFALPGNPLSTLVTYKLFVEPSLVRWHGGEPREWRLEATATNAFHRTPGRTEFLRACLTAEDGRLTAHVLPGQGSHQLGALRETNGLIRVEAVSTGFAAGDRVTVLPFDFLGDSP